MFPLGHDSHSLGNRSCTHTGSCIHKGSGTGTGNRKGRCSWRGVVQLLQDVPSLLAAGRRGGLPDVQLGVCTGMGSGMGSRVVDRGIVRNARDTLQGSTHHWLVLKTKMNDC